MKALKYFLVLIASLVQHKVSRVYTVTKALGVVKGIYYLRVERRNNTAYRQKASGTGKNEQFLLKAPHLQYPVTGRVGSSDLWVYEQMFIQHEYSCLPDMPSVQTIVDCGGNVGYASAYLLSRFPNARLVAVEPDSDNFALLQRNIAPYGTRATALQAGVWSHSTDLVVRRSNRGGEEWAFTVEESKPGETPDVHAIGINEIMAHYAMDYIDILKVDIEGSEKEVFGANTADWINHVGLLVMELHGPLCEEAVQKALSHLTYTKFTFEELTVFDFTDRRNNDAVSK